MKHVAHALIVDADAGRAEALRPRLAVGGYHAVRAASAAVGAAMAAAELPDLVLIAQSDSIDAIALGRSLKESAETADIAVAALFDHPSGSVSLDGLAAGLDDVLSVCCGDAELLARLHPLARLSTLRAELRRRAEVAQRFGLPVPARPGPDPIAAAQRPAVVLIVGDAPHTAEDMLAGQAELVRAATLPEAEEVLGRGGIDAAVLSFAATPEETLYFCAHARNNPRLFNLPMLLLADPGLDADAAYRQGASRVLTLPVEPSALQAAVLTLARRQQARRLLGTALAECLRPPVGDGATGTYGRAFLEAYLENAPHQGRAMAVALFAAPNIEVIRRQFGDDAAAHLSRQVGQWIAGLLRVEDLVASVSASQFCVVLPDTPLHEAEMVTHRIAGVLAYTDFAVRDVYQPVKAWIQAGCAMAEAGDTLESVAGRIRRNLR